MGGLCFCVVYLSVDVKSKDGTWVDYGPGDE